MIRLLENRNLKLIIPYLIMAFMYFQVTSLFSRDQNPSFSGDQSDCSEKLDQAEEFYYDGDFEQTIKIVNHCLQKQSLPLEIQVRSYTILAKTYLAQNDTNRTKDNIRIILKLDPSYQPTIEQETPTYVNLVEEIKKEEKQAAVIADESGISKWWYIGAGGMAAIAIIAVFASGSSSDDQTGTPTSLPGPPDFPE